ncbi:MAG: hypothetical protein K2X04_03425 [Burkholderiales bacterium]|nr:hypothetical protein [Burkholderiales bacterium]
MYTPYTKEQEDDFDRFILPAYLQLARNDSLRFCVRDNQEKVIICSNDYANDIGYYDYNEAMNKRPDYEYERRTGTPEHFIMQMNYINSTKKSFNYTYINKTDNQLYLTLLHDKYSGINCLQSVA